MKRLSQAQLEELRQFDTPTVCNTIQRFKVRPQTEGFTGPVIRAVFADQKPFVGYACTAKIRASRPATDEQKELLFRYYAHVKETPMPQIAVIEDLDPTPVGSFWGEVQVSTHQALGCAGLVTSGGVRDLDEVHAMGFGYLASQVLVSHAYVHVEDVACPVQIGGLTVNPGDLIHADKHGAVLIPHEIADQLAAACREVQQAEEPMIRALQAKKPGDVTVDELRALREEMVRKRG